LATLLYGQIVHLALAASSPTVAELAKFYENTFRSVNIALANEFALMYAHLGVSVWEVIEAAATKPFGFIPFFSGPGIGGCCIPIDPLYLAWKLLKVVVLRQASLGFVTNARVTRHVVVPLGPQPGRQIEAAHPGVVLARLMPRDQLYLQVSREARKHT